MSGIHPRPDTSTSDGTQQSGWLLRKRDCEQVLSMVASGALNVSDEYVRNVEAARDEAQVEASKLARRHAAARASTF